MTQSKDEQAIYEQNLVRRISDLPREIKPDTDVWPGIAARISKADQEMHKGHPGPQGPASRFAHTWPYALAASFTLMIAAGIFLRSPEQAPSGMPPLADSPTDIAVNTNEYVPTGLSAIIEPEYQAAFREFMALSPVPEYMDDSASRWVEQVWTGLRNAETELAAALAIEPQSRFLNTRMAAVRAHQLDLLKEIAEMNRISRRNTI
jgi:hypothetical protein